MASIEGRVVAIAPAKDVVRLSLNRIQGIKPFIVGGKELPVGALKNFLRAAMKSDNVD